MPDDTTRCIRHYSTSERQAHGCAIVARAVATSCCVGVWGREIDACGALGQLCRPSAPQGKRYAGRSPARSRRCNRPTTVAGWRQPTLLVAAYTTRAVLHCMYRNVGMIGRGRPRCAALRRTRPAHFTANGGETRTIAYRFLTAHRPFRATMSALSAKLFWRHNCDHTRISN